MKCKNQTYIVLNGQTLTVFVNFLTHTHINFYPQMFPCAGATVSGSEEFGEGDGFIFLDDLLCSGDESTLLSCPHGGIGLHNCRHDEDIAVICSSPPSPTLPPPITPGMSQAALIVPSCQCSYTCMHVYLRIYYN